LTRNQAVASTTTPVPASTLELKPWRVGAVVHRDGDPCGPTCEPLPGELDELDKLRPAIRPRPEGVHSITHLVAEKRVSCDLERFRRSVLALSSTSTQTLILKITTCNDPLMLWAIHVTLDGRNIIPALRWPANTSTEQMKFIGWLADLLWFTKRTPDHQPKFRGWVRLLAETPANPAWQDMAYWIFVAMYDRQNISSYTARGLALTPAQRQPLMSLPTARMVTARLELQPIPFAETRQRLLSHAVAHPDKSGTRTPEAITNRRAGLWRTFLLSEKRQTATAENWKLLTGEPLSRQAISRHLETIKTILKN